MISKEAGAEMYVFRKLEPIRCSWREDYQTKWMSWRLVWIHTQAPRRPSKPSNPVIIVHLIVQHSQRIHWWMANWDIEDIDWHLEKASKEYQTQLCRRVKILPRPCHPRIHKRVTWSKRQDMIIEATNHKREWNCSPKSQRNFQTIMKAWKCWIRFEANQR